MQSFNHDDLVRIYSADRLIIFGNYQSLFEQQLIIITVANRARQLPRLLKQQWIVFVAGGQAVLECIPRVGALPQRYAVRPFECYADDAWWRTPVPRQGKPKSLAASSLITEWALRSSRAELHHKV